MRELAQSEITIVNGAEKSPLPILYMAMGAVVVGMGIFALLYRNCESSTGAGFFIGFGTAGMLGGYSFLD